MKTKILVLIVTTCIAALLSGCDGNNQPSAGNGQASGGAGAEIFQQNCASCHGNDARGRRGVGPDLTVSEFVQSQSDEELVAFIKQGRPVDHPDNTTGIPMPPKGGNRSLRDAQLMEIVTWIRSISQG